ncbi:MAG: hypothetical protein WCF57_02175 [Pyrinomonadaceae bacterium]
MKPRLLMILLTISFNMTLTFAQTNPDAVVVSVKGTAFAKKTKGGASIPLKKGDKLFAGDQVKCERGCRELKISYCHVTRPVTNSPKWKTILAINCGVLDGERGGGDKGEGITIISPRESATIRPETFSLKWEPNKSPSKINLSLRIYLGEEIWVKRDVDGSLGSFESNCLKLELKEAQKAGHLSLIIVSKEGADKEPQRVKFKLISLEDQQSLNSKLEVFGHEPDKVLKTIGRGLAFSEYELYAEAVQEFEKALKILQSQNVNEETLTGIRRLTIMANYRVYNDERVKQLCASLKKSDSAPIACSQDRQ